MIPFVDLKAQYAGIKQEVNAAIQGILDSCAFTLGSEVVEFEKEFAAYSGSKLGIGVNTGTSALHLALLAADVGPGDEVITVSHHLRGFCGCHPLHGRHASAGGY